MNTAQAELGTGGVELNNPSTRLLRQDDAEATRSKRRPFTLRHGRSVRRAAGKTAGKLPEHAARPGDPTLRGALSPARCDQDPADAFEKGVSAQPEDVSVSADLPTAARLSRALESDRPLAASAGCPRILVAEGERRC
jgi:hypothetical protein